MMYTRRLVFTAEILSLLMELCDLGLPFIGPSTNLAACDRAKLAFFAYHGADLVGPNRILMRFVVTC